MTDKGKLPELHPQYAPRLNPRSDADSLWEGEVTPDNVEHIRLRLEGMLLGRAFTMTRAYEYNGWELEMFPICRFKDTGEDAGVYVHNGHVEFAAADWHWVIGQGYRLRLERDRASWTTNTSEGRAYRVGLVRLEDERNLNVVLGPSEAALAHAALSVALEVDRVHVDAYDVRGHIERVHPDSERWLPVNRDGGA